MDIGSTNGDVWYPVYDGHGNMVATLSKSGSGYNVANRRSYDPWGNLRLGSIYTEVTGRYCANLGHKTDDESAMIYMRARYYEPSVGRFISEDPAMDGKNRFTYCDNDPVSNIDESGEISHPILALLLVIGMFEFFWQANDPAEKIVKTLLASVLLGIAAVEAAISSAMAADPRQIGLAHGYLALSVGAASILLICAISQVILLAMIANLDTNDPEADKLIEKAGSPFGGA